MNEKDYPTLYKSIGAFDIFKSQYYSGCYVRALSNRKDHDRVLAISHLMIDLNDEMFRRTDSDTRHHVIRRRNIADKRTKQQYYEIALETVLKPAEVETWLADYGHEIPVLEQSKEEFSAERVSVGPCRYQDKETQYVRIRFDGYSVPLHFTAGLGSGKLEGNWDVAATTIAVKQELPNDPATVEEIMNMFKAGDTASKLIDRAWTRPLNLSNIVESGSFSPTFYVPVSYKNILVHGLPGAGYGGKNVPLFEGYKAVKEKNELAVPGLEPLAVFLFTCHPGKDKYGYITHRSLLVIVGADDKVYTAERTYNWYGLGSNRALSATEDMRYLGAEAVIKTEDFKPLDEQDVFVRERAGRALSRKL